MTDDQLQDLKISVGAQVINNKTDLYNVTDAVSDLLNNVVAKTVPADASDDLKRDMKDVALQALFNYLKGYYGSKS